MITVDSALTTEIKKQSEFIEKCWLKATAKNGVGGESSLAFFRAELTRLEKN